MFFYFGIIRNASRIGIAAMLLAFTCTVNAVDLFVGFPGASGSKDLVCDKWELRDSVPFERDTGIYKGPYVCTKYHLVESNSGKVYIEKLLTGVAPAPVEFSGGRQAKSQWAPSMAKFNGHYYMAYKDGSSDRIYYSWSQDGKHWTQQYAVNGLTSESTPQLQVFRGRLYLFFVRRDKAVVYTSTADGSNWTALKHTGAGSAKPPTFTLFNGRMFMAYRGKSSQYIYVQHTTNGTSWSSPVLIRQKTSEAPGIAAHRNQLFIVFKGGSTQNIYTIRSSDGVNWSSATRPNQYWKTDKGPDIESFGGKLYLAFKGLNTDRVYYSSSTTGTGSWATYKTRPYTRTKGMLNLSVY
jgi:hypothetical protein